MDEAGYLRGVCRSAERNEMRKPEDYRGIELWSFFIYSICIRESGERKNTRRKSRIFCFW